MKPARFLALCLALAFAPLAAVAADPAEAPASQAEPPRLHPPPVPYTPAALEQSIRRGLDFLLQDQNADGSWGTAQRTKELNIYAPVPGSHHAFRSAVTAMVILALIDTGAADRDEPARQALARGEAWLLEKLPLLRRANPTAIYNVWSHAYGIQALAAMHARAAGDPERQKLIRHIITGQIQLLAHYESVDGGWGYYDFRVGAKQPASSSTSFVTATVLIAFDRARQIGIEVPETLVRRGIASINRQRKNDHSYVYGEYLKYRPMLGVNRTAGSLGRSQACNLALRLWDDKTVTDTVLDDCLKKLFDRNDWLGMGRKRPIPHESWFQVAGYFYYYGHYYAALCLEQLADKTQADQHRRALAGILMALQEKDGSWWDFPLYNYHQQYGTAFALMSLARCRGAAAAGPPQ